MNNVYMEQLLASVDLIGKHPYFTEDLVKTQALLFSASGKIEESDTMTIFKMFSKPESEEIIEEPISE